MTEKTKFNPFFPYLQHNEAFVWIGKPASEKWLKQQTKPKDEHLLRRLQIYFYLFSTAFFLWVFIYAQTCAENFLLFMTGIGIILLLILIHNGIVRFNIHQDRHHK